ncbi:class I SAM-dependent DNA methyltransferase [Anaerobiospirillum succiniciproducens]|uniref:class I SAM-dependent DNA methyltransferase n=1 Tax=Anaerobiospirillum succiniciproducens TaxID=13335 RepID=UPI0023576EB3|nr:DNA methyltransferase [Anaerobiospirillum succiniciproducens]MCI6864272.1 N-6 DNA methylase [Anaerobiospirillum succiniciproducens]
MAKSSSKDLSILISELSESMQKHWEPDVFFAELMRMYGTANNSIEMALKNEKGFNVAAKGQELTMAREDLAITNRAYFRFVRNDEDVASALEDVRNLKEVTGPKYKFQFLICAGPTSLAMFDAVEHDSIMIAYKDLPRFYSFLMPLLDGRKAKITSTMEADRKACLKLTRLLDTLAEHNNISDENMQQFNSFMVRILFCFFAEDTGVFGMGDDNVFSNAFNKLVNREGSNAKKFFEDIFTVFNTKEHEREHLENKVANEILEFPYVNGGLFAESGFIPEFDIVTRNQFIDCGKLSWSEISPAVFGSMFQGAMSKEERRNMGAHYTSEENILKVIKPLFLDDLYAEFEKLKKKAEPLKLGAATAKRADTSRRKNSAVRKMFYDFLEEIGKLKFLDPACGCGNFLLVTYKELRTLENEVFDYINEGAFTNSFINIDQFYGIEIEDWPVEIAHVSMWLMQHLMNQQANARFGSNISSIPLKSSATIVRANALTTDWNDILPASECSYILGNPPFGGANYVSYEQKDWLKAVYPPKHKLGFVDFVTAWFVKASDYMLQNKQVQSAFVATNSICQGQQVETLWELLLNKGIHINFAYTSFPWNNDAAGKAIVTCVIVGFSYTKASNHVLYIYDIKTRDFIRHGCHIISPYLCDSSNPVIVRAKSKAFDQSKNLSFGNMPNDGGNLIMSYKEGQKFLNEHQEIRPFVKRFIGSSELMKSEFRYCFWFNNESEVTQLNLLEVKQRVDKVRDLRLSSTRESTRKVAEFPWRFGELSNPPNPERALVIPSVTSERRKYVPIGFVDQKYIVSNAAFLLPNATYYDFGVLTSLMHNVWIRFTSGRLESRIRYSRDMTFNTFVWPEVTKEQHDEIEELAKNIMRVRVDHITDDLTLGELYNPETKPQDLKEAHEKLDAAVERAYREEPFKDDDERLSFLLDLYGKAIDAEKAEAELHAKTKRKRKCKKSS